MLYNSCVVKYSKIYRAYAELCTTSWPSVLINRQIWESIFSFHVFIKCSKNYRPLWCSDAVIFFATLFFCYYFFLNTVLYIIMQFVNYVPLIQDTCVKWGILGVPFYMHVVQFMCGQMQHNIQQGIWSF